MSADIDACLREGEHVKTQRHPEASCPLSTQELPKSGIPDEQVDDLCRRAYVLALESSHPGARVTIHLSKALADRIKNRASMPETIQTTWMWGFPAERHDDWAETRIEIHAVTTVR